MENLRYRHSRSAGDTPYDGESDDNSLLLHVAKNSLSWEVISQNTRVLTVISALVLVLLISLGIAQWKITQLLEQVRPFTLPESSLEDEEEVHTKPTIVGVLHADDKNSTDDLHDEPLEDTVEVEETHAEAPGGGDHNFETAEQMWKHIHKKSRQHASLRLKYTTNATISQRTAQVRDIVDLIKAMKKRFGGDSHEYHKAHKLARELEVQFQTVGPYKWKQFTWLTGNYLLHWDKPGGIHVLIFWEIWCPHCKHEIPRLMEVRRKLQNLDNGKSALTVPFTGVTTLSKHSTAQSVQDWVNKIASGVEFPTIHDEHKSLTKQFHVSGVPAAAVLCKLPNNTATPSTTPEHKDQLQHKEAIVLWRGHAGKLYEKEFVVYAHECQQLAKQPNLLL
eukprot:TRINITY_DN48426_c0_g1_i1.p1 TRINITY_DN48426_c0_g1~~TRINITY_DN48426_c0_g1_i1.p1  ORF type:complete len:392 (-),score=48.48 TRINITY_DN48426_c0_g1_i1:46-1221(-)